MGAEADRDELGVGEGHASEAPLELAHERDEFRFVVRRVRDEQFVAVALNGGLVGGGRGVGQRYEGREFRPAHAVGLVKLKNPPALQVVMYLGLCL